MKREKLMATMRLKEKTLATLMITLVIISTIYFGHAAPRMARAQEIAESFNFDEEGAKFEMSILVESTHHIENMYNAFQYLTLDNLEWVGTFPPGPGQEQGPDVHLQIGSALMEEDQGNSHLFVTDPMLTILMEGLVNLQVEAANATVDFVPGGGETGSLTMTVVLKDVNFGISMSILPLPGLTTALYSYSGPELTIAITFIEKCAISIENPEEGSILNGVIPVQAEIHTAEGMTLEEVWFKPTWYSKPSWNGHREWIEEFEENQPMTWNEELGLWEGQWVTPETPDGEYVFEVFARIVEDSTGEWDTWTNLQTVSVENEEWRIGERIRISGAPNHRNLPADQPYYVAHGWVHWDWYELSQEERDDILYGSAYGFDLYIREPESQEWEQVDLDLWTQYHRWDYFGEPGEEDFQRRTDVMHQTWHVEYEEGEFEPGETYSFKGLWTWQPDPEDPEDPGQFEVIVDITFI